MAKRVGQSNEDTDFHSAANVGESLFWRGKKSNTMYK